jgi:hypothetical protein
VLFRNSSLFLLQALEQRAKRSAVMVLLLLHVLRPRCNEKNSKGAKTTEATAKFMNVRLWVVTRWWTACARIARRLESFQANTRTASKQQIQPFFSN